MQRDLRLFGTGFHPGSMSVHHLCSGSWWDRWGWRLFFAIIFGLLSKAFFPEVNVHWSWCGHTYGHKCWGSLFWLLVPTQFKHQGSVSRFTAPAFWFGVGYTLGWFTQSTIVMFGGAWGLFDRGLGSFLGRGGSFPNVEGGCLLFFFTGDWDGDWACDSWDCW